MSCSWDRPDHNSGCECPRCTRQRPGRVIPRQDGASWEHHDKAACGCSFCEGYRARRAAAERVEQVLAEDARRLDVEQRTIARACLYRLDRKEPVWDAWQSHSRWATQRDLYIMGDDSALADMLAEVTLVYPPLAPKRGTRVKRWHDIDGRPHAAVVPTLYAQLASAVRGHRLAVSGAVCVVAFTVAIVAGITSAWPLVIVAMALGAAAGMFAGTD